MIERIAEETGLAFSYCLVDSLEQVLNADFDPNKLDTKTYRAVIGKDLPENASPDHVILWVQDAKSYLVFHLPCGWNMNRHLVFHSTM